MKKFTASILLFVMLMTLCIPVFAVEYNDAESKIVESIIDVPVGTEVDAVFVCSEASNNLTLRKGTTKLASMNDNGRNGDVKQHDGVSGAKISLFSNERRTDTYYAYSDGEVVTTYTVNFYNVLTDADFAVKDSINSHIDTIVNSMKSNDEQTVANAVYDYLSTCPDIESVARTESGISYTTQAGITSVYAEFSENMKGSETVLSMPDTAVKSEKVGSVVSWTNPNVLVMRPFRNSLSDAGAGFASDVYKEAADKITSVTGGETIMFDDEEANPYNFAENLDKVGFLLIDSHGLDVSIDGVMSSVIIMENVNNDGITSADWSSGRVVDIYNEGLIGVSGDYIKAHYTEENRKLENTVCYLGICLGMKYDSIKVPLSEMGARCVLGYTETVSTYYDNIMLDTITDRLALKSTESADRNSTLSESIAYAKIQHGEEDPSGWGAKLETYGNPETALLIPDNHATELAFTATEYSAVVGNNTSIPILVRSNDREAYGYTQEWFSSDESIVKVIGPRMITGVSEGKATVTCKISGEGYNLEKSCIVNVTYIPAESISLIISSKNLIVGEKLRPVCTIYPRNASDRSYSIFSTNPGSASISNGVITAGAPGTTTIYAKSTTGVLCAETDMSVSTKKVLKQTSETNSDGSFAFYSRGDGDSLLGGSISNDYLKAVSVAPTNGYISTGTSDSNLWMFEYTDEGFYLRSKSSGNYLTLNSSTEPELTENALSVFEFVGNKLRVVNTEESSRFLSYRQNKGFYFSTQGKGARFEVYRLLDYGDENMYKTVSFDTGDKTYTQYVEVGCHAVAVCPQSRDGYTFLGWDKPLSDISESFSTTALYRTGTSDKVIITFMHTDGSIISTVELASGESIVYPEVADERDGLAFSNWSESDIVANHNMTVFAIYKEAALLGDVTGDGVVNTGDAVVILRAAASLMTLNAEQTKTADVTGDGHVNTGDAVVILRYAAGIVSSFN